MVPGVAFETEERERGVVRRLGHGKGLYDYFLHRYWSLDEHETEKAPHAKMALFGHMSLWDRTIAFWEMGRS